MVLVILTLQEAASKMHPECHFDPNFSHYLDWGTKITLEKFRKLGFYFCILLALPAETCVIYEKFKKSDKNHSICAKTAYNHW